MTCLAAEENDFNSDGDSDEEMVDATDLDPGFSNDDDGALFEAYMQDTGIEDYDPFAPESSNRGQRPPATVEDFVEEKFEEEVEEQEPDIDYVQVEYFKKERRAGHSFGSSPTKFEQWRDELAGAMAGENPPPFSPTLDERNWGKAHWLATSGLSGKGRNRYFDLKEVRNLATLHVW